MNKFGIDVNKYVDGLLNKPPSECFDQGKHKCDLCNKIAVICIRTALSEWHWRAPDNFSIGRTIILNNIDDNTSFDKKPRWELFNLLLDPDKQIYLFRCETCWIDPEKHPYYFN